MRDYISSLVQQSLKDYLKRDHSQSHLLVMLTNDRAHSKDVWEHIEILASEYDVTLLVSEREKEKATTLHVDNILFLESISIEDIASFSRGIDLLYCPVISHGFLAKLSLLLDDSKSVWIALQLILEGKEVLLGSDVIQQKRRMIFWQKPVIDKKVQNYVKDLRKDGINFCTMKHVLKMINTRIKVAHDRKPLLLAKHVEEVAKSGLKEIDVPKNSLITPMAKDVARELQVAIKEKSDEER